MGFLNGPYIPSDGTESPNSGVGDNNPVDTIDTRNATPVQRAKKSKRDHEQDLESNDNPDDHPPKRKRVTVDEVDLDTLTREIRKQCLAGIKEYFEHEVNLDTLTREVSKQCLAGIKQHLEQTFFLFVTVMYTMEIRIVNCAGVGLDAYLFAGRRFCDRR
ncbi:hypothetical protein BGW80DRAFT_1253775 [Lactifluus volemus]|nr:hypothetical protein BGW80DRAFT_1253775 [Lactifluus volemus]